jgi:hypothetical protein
VSWKQYQFEKCFAPHRELNKFNHNPIPFPAANVGKETTAWLQLSFIGNQVKAQIANIPRAHPSEFLKKSPVNLLSSTFFGHKRDNSSHVSHVLL